MTMMDDLFDIDLLDEKEMAEWSTPPMYKKKARMVDDHKNGMFYFIITHNQTIVYLPLSLAHFNADIKSSLKRITYSPDPVVTSTTSSDDITNSKLKKRHVVADFTGFADSIGFEDSTGFTNVKDPPSVADVGLQQNAVESSLPAPYGNMHTESFRYYDQYAQKHGLKKASVEQAYAMMKYGKLKT